MTPTNELPVDDVSGVEERPQNRREWRGALRSLVLPVLIVATIVGGLAYIERERGGSGSVATDGTGIVALPAENNVTGEGVSTEVGRAAPDFLLKMTDGSELRLSDLQGTPVLVNFWASWCTPCRQEMPEIVKAYDARAAGAFTVVAVDLQENTGQINDFAGEFGMKFPIVVDRNGGVADAWRIGGPIEGIPASYFLDEHGVVQARVFGPMTAETLAANLRTIGVGR